MPAPALRMWQCAYGTCMRRPRLHSLAHPACIGVPPHTPSPPTPEKAIASNLLFEGLPPSALDAIIDSMQPRAVGPNKDIIKQVGYSASSLHTGILSSVQRSQA